MDIVFLCKVQMTQKRRDDESCRFAVVFPIPFSVSASAFAVGCLRWGWVCQIYFFISSVSMFASSWCCSA